MNCARNGTISRKREKERSLSENENEEKIEKPRPFCATKKYARKTKLMMRVLENGLLKLQHFFSRKTKLPSFLASKQTDNYINIFSYKYGAKL